MEKQSLHAITMIIMVMKGALPTSDSRRLTLQRTVHVHYG